MPPLDALTGWAERHNIPAYIVQRSIARKGTPAQPFMKPALEFEKNNWLKNIKKVVKNIR